MNRHIRPYDILLDAARPDAWSLLKQQQVVFDEGRLRLAPLEGTRPDLADGLGVFSGHTLPRGVAIWRDQIFVTDPSRDRVLRWRPCCGAPRPLPAVGRGAVPLDQPRPCVADVVTPQSSIGPRDLNGPRGLAISARDDLVVVDSGNRRLLFFTLPNLALRRIVGPLSSPEDKGQEWQPVDAASGPGGWLYVADARGRVWRIDSQGRPDPLYAGRLPPGTVPFRVVVDSERRAYLLAEGSRRVLILDRYGQLFAQPEELSQRADTWLAAHLLAVDAPPPAHIPTIAEDAAALAAMLPAELAQRLVGSLRGWLRSSAPQTFASDPDRAWASYRQQAYDTVLPESYRRLLPDFLGEVLPRTPLSLDGDRVLLTLAQPHVCQPQPQPTDLFVDTGGRMVLDDSQDGPFLMRRLQGADYAPGGLLRLASLDSGHAGNPWHRVVLDLRAPERTAVRLFGFTSDVPRDDLDTTGLLAEPPELGLWQAAPANAEEWLVQSSPGRYLCLALTFKGPGDNTPEVERIYVYAQRHSSLRYLPAVYQADETSRALLDRLLSLFDTIFGEIESAIEDFPLLLDVAGVPSDFLPWLASWFDLDLERSWSDGQRRAFLQNLMKLYRWRGTVAGLRLLLRLHTGLSDPMPGIVEHFRGIGTVPLERWLGPAPDADQAHHFTILLPSYQIDTAEKRATIARLVDAAIPAHTHYTLRTVRRGMRLVGPGTVGSALGLDSLLGTPAAWRLSGEGASDDDGILGARTILPSKPEARAVSLQIGKTRLGAWRLGGRAATPCDDLRGDST
jgi:phage tail-like protein